ncbi:hypothetical protein AB0F15_00660 [Amycolatopsis sp. NPDC026612]
MSCGHCAQSVAEELTAPAADDVRAAVGEAGFLFEGAADLIP